MARIDVLPSIEIIRGLKGILDFYVWRGLPCVRAWPKYRPAKQTAASLAAALVFGAIVKAYSTMGEIALQAYRDDATGQPRSARDVYVSSQYGNLHEADMSDFLDLLQESRDFLSDLTALLDALHSINTDELVVRTEHSVLPDGAATAAAQATQLTALQKIDDLQDALQSKGLDRLIVRSEAQLFSVNNRMGSIRNAVISGAGGFVDSHPAPANRIWIITNVSGLDRTTATTQHWYAARYGGVSHTFGTEIRAIPANHNSFWSGFVVLWPTDSIRVSFTGGLAGDSCDVVLTGYEMILET